MSTNELYHHGILGQKWGVRNGPPYPLSGGDYTQLEQKKIKAKRKSRNSIYNKKHYDEVLKKDDTTLSTLSYDKNRLKDADMFYATYDWWDKQEYRALFNKPIKDIKGNQTFKYSIDTALKSDIKVASEDSGIKAFSDLYKNDRDFYNYVTDESRMQSYFDDTRYRFKGYRDARKSLQKMKDPNYKPTSDDVANMYRMFNYNIPYDGQGNARAGKDALNQRTKFFNALKKHGYGAVLDTNDAIYGGYKAKAPVIVFDMEQTVPKDVWKTKSKDKAVANVAFAVRKVTGI